MSSVAILSFSHISSDARVLRQIKYLSRHWSVTAIGYGSLASDGTAIRTLSLPQGYRAGLLRKVRTLMLLLAGRIVPARAYEALYWSVPVYRIALDHLLSSCANVIHANDWAALPVAIYAARRLGAKVVLDLHEYAPLEFESLRHRVLTKPMIEYFIGRYAPCTTASITVCESIAERYAREFTIHPIVVMNASETAARPPEFHPTDDCHIRLIHHGAAMPERRLDLMIEALAQTDERFSLHMMLAGYPEYVAHLRARGDRLAPGRVFFHPPVSPDSIVNRIAEYDMGIFVLPFLNYNWKVSLPNKLFDFINAALAVCIGPSPEMARLLGQHGCGMVAPSFEPKQVAQVLNSLTASEIDRMKRNSIAARMTLNADVEMNKVIALYNQLPIEGPA